MKMMRTKASIAILTVAGLALTGCARGGDTAPEAGSAEALQSGLITTTPSPSGEIDKIAWNNPYGEPASLDPVKSLNYPEALVTANLCESLFQQQPDLSSAPNLAESFEVSDDLKTYTFKIREGVQFWDGSEMTVDDVVYSLSRHLDPAEGSFWAGDVTNIDRIEATGDHEVTVTLKAPDSVFVDKLLTPIGAVVSQAYREQAGENYGNPQELVMCTGPFSVSEWRQGQSITLDRNDAYWNADRMPLAAQVEIGFVVDPVAIANGLIAGDIQGSYDVPLSAIAQLEASDSGTLFDGVGTQIMAVISTGDGAFGDPAVRRAITRATDRQAIAETVFEGTGLASKSLVADAAWENLPHAAEMRGDSLPDLSYDIDAAKAELEAAEADLAQPIRIAYPSERSFYADILNEMANGAKELGLTLEPVGVPSAQFGAFFTDPAARAGYDGFVTTNYPTSSEPITYLSRIAGPGGAANFNDFSDPDTDRLIAATFSEADPDTRGELSVQTEALVMQQLPWVPVVSLNSRLFMNNEITGAPASFVYLFYPWAADLGAA